MIVGRVPLPHGGGIGLLGAVLSEARVLNTSNRDAEADDDMPRDVSASPEGNLDGPDHFEAVLMLNGSLPPRNAEQHARLRSIRRLNPHWKPGVLSMRLPARGPLRASEPRFRPVRPRSRTPRSRRTRTARATRAGPLADSDGDPPPVAHLRGFIPAPVRMVRHIERRLGARAA